MPNTLHNDAIRAINFLTRWASTTSKDKGFHDVVFTAEQAAIITSIALIGTEVSELLDVYRRDGHHHSPEFRAEGSDILIRTFDLFGRLGIDLGEATITKMIKNESRPRLHGKAF